MLTVRRKPPRISPTRPLLALLALVLAMFTLPALPAAAEPAPAAAVDWLSVDGNQIRDAAGRPVTLRGVSLSGPRHRAECTDCTPRSTAELIDQAVDETAGWNSRVLRLPVTEWAPNDSLTLAENIERHVDPYVQQAVDLGVYIIVDFHRVQNFGTENGGVPGEIVQEFWEYVAPRYADIPNVIYEVYNEPINPASWPQWKSYIQPVVDGIRAVAPNNLLLMGGPNWSTMVNQAAADPIDDANTAYVYHLYPNQGAATAANLDQRFGNAAQQIPVILTEFGWNPAGPYSDPTVTQGTTGCWGSPLRDYLDARPHISWTAWTFDNYWKPQMFDEDWNLLGGEHQGQFVQDWLADLADHNQAGRDNAPGADDALGSDPGPEGVIVDNGGAGYTDTGDWPRSTSTAGFYGTDYAHSGSANASPAKTAVFQPTLPATGTYNVYLRWTPNANRATAAPVTIHDGSGGSAGVTVDQRTNGCQWNLLGTYELTAGSNARLELSAASAGYTIADAALFEPVG
ncbi:cellulase family glycosylhydrolase [Streptomyces mayteni]